MDHRELGWAVRLTRKQQGMTQADLARLAGVSRDFLLDLEAGHPNARLEKALQIISALGLGNFLANVHDDLFGEWTLMPAGSVDPGAVEDLQASAPAAAAPAAGSHDGRPVMGVTSESGVPGPTMDRPHELIPDAGADVVPAVDIEPPRLVVPIPDASGPELFDPDLFDPREDMILDGAEF